MIYFNTWFNPLPTDFSGKFFHVKNSVEIFIGITLNMCLELERNDGCTLLSLSV